MPERQLRREDSRPFLSFLSGVGCMLMSRYKEPHILPVQGGLLPADDQDLGTDGYARILRVCEASMVTDYGNHR